VKVRYTGAMPVTFIQLGREVKPGEEFDVPDADAEGYLARGDVQSAEPEPEKEEEQPSAPAPRKGAPKQEKPAAQAPDDTVTA
jgi:hypothetical protein